MNTLPTPDAENQTSPPSESPVPSRRKHWIIIALVVLGILMVGFFGMRAYHSFDRMRRGGFHPGMTNVEDIRGWMTIPHIAKDYQVEPNFLFDAVGVPPKGNDEKSLSDLNREFKAGQPGFMVETIKKAIREYWSLHPSPPPPPPPHPAEPLSTKHP